MSIHLTGSVGMTGSLSISRGLRVTGSLVVTGSDAIINGVTVGVGPGFFTSSQVVVGYNALQSTTVNGYSTAIGAEALTANTTGLYNTAIGYQALRSNLIGAYGTAIGYQALSESVANYNTAIGYRAMRRTTTGAGNTAIGYLALVNNISGSNNVSIGLASMAATTSGSNNVAVGYFAGYNNTSGSNNTFVGYNTGLGITTGSNNTIIGANVTGLAAALANNVIIADGSGNRRINIDDNGNVGIGTTTPNYKLEVVGSARIASNLTATGSIFFPNITTAAQSNVLTIDTSTGQLYYTSSAGIGGAYLPLAGGTLTGTLSGSNAFFTGTLTVQTLVAQTVTSSTEYITGSTRFGSLQTNTHDFTGSVNITGSLNSPNITGSLYGTASNISGGTNNYIPLWTGSSGLTTSVLYQSQSKVGIDTTTPVYKLDVNGTGRFSSDLTIGGDLYMISYKNLYVERGTGGFSNGLAIEGNHVFNGSNVTQSILKILSSGISKIIPTAGSSNIYNLIHLGPQYSASVADTGITKMRGVYYDPTITGSITALTNIAWENTIGDAFFGTVSGSVGIGPNASGLSTSYKLIVSGSGVSGSLNVNNVLYVSSSRVGINKLVPTYSLDVAGTVYISASNNTTSSLTVYGSGSVNPLFKVQGSQGELFTVTDSLSGSLFSVNDISGLPILEVFSDETTLIGSYLAPALNATTKTTINTGTGTVIYQIPTSSYDGAWFEYVAKSGSVARVGQIMAMWSGSSTTMIETTSSIGAASAVTFSMIFTGSNAALTGSATTTGWIVKTIVRSI